MYLFSAGPRNCIGQYLAQIEAKIIMGEFIKRFNFTISEGYVHRMMYRFLQGPDQDLILDLTKKDGDL